MTPIPPKTGGSHGGGAGCARNDLWPMSSAVPA